MTGCPLQDGGKFGSNCEHQLVHPEPDQGEEPKTAGNETPNIVVQELGLSNRSAKGHGAWVVATEGEGCVFLELVPQDIGRRRELAASAEDDSGKDARQGHQEKRIPPPHPRLSETALHEKYCCHGRDVDQAR